MKMMQTACVVATAGLWSGLCLAQGADSTTRMGDVSVTTTTARAADPDVEAVKALLVGSWKTTMPNPATGEPAEMWMHIAPIQGEGLQEALYVEHAWGESLAFPARQSIFELYRYKGDRIRLRTLDFKTPARAEVLGSWWVAPDALPPISRGDLIATLDVELRRNGSAWSGKTPYPYPTARDGAVEMTTDITLNRSELVTHDVGFDANGQVVWGGTADKALKWTRANAGFNVTRSEEGLIVVTLSEGEGEPAVDGNRVHVHYSGWLADGDSLESTRRFEQAYIAALPFQGIEGWNRILTGIKKGQHVRFVLPPALAFKDQQQGRIPPNSTLYFEMECMHIDVPEPAPAPQPAGPDAGGADGG